jgi:hypothetical protein
MRSTTTPAARTLRLGLGLLVAVLASLPRAALSGAPTGQYDVGANGTPQYGTVLDTKTRLRWQRTPTAQVAWSDAANYCTYLVLGGLSSGWRLPTAKELTTLYDEIGTVAPYVDQTAFPNTPSGAFWSGTLFVNSTGGNGSVTSAMTLDFSSQAGSLVIAPVSSLLYARCVHEVP